MTIWFERNRHVPRAAVGLAILAAGCFTTRAASAQAPAPTRTAPRSAGTAPGSAPAAPTPDNAPAGPERAGAGSASPPQEGESSAQADTRGSQNPQGGSTNADRTARGSALVSAPGSALGIELELTGSGLDASELQQALEAELGVPVAPATEGERLRLRIEGDTLEAAYGDPNRRVVSRRVSLPKDPTQALELIRLLVANLVADEASALLARLRREAQLRAQEASEAESGAHGEAKAPGEPEPQLNPAQTPDATPAAAKPTAPTVDGRPEPEPNDEAAPLPPRKSTPISITLFSPVSTDPWLAEHEAHFDLGLFYSKMGRLRGFAANAGVVELADGGRGFVSSAIATLSDGPISGLNASGIFSRDGGVRGLTASGIVAIHDGPSRGLTASLVTVGQGYWGAQAGLVNINHRSQDGAQFGLINWGGGGMSGAQVGLINIQQGDIRGAQVGLVNVSGGKYSGTPIGLVNVGASLRARAVAWASMNPELDNPARQLGPMAHLGVKYELSSWYSVVAFGVAAEAEGCGQDPACRSEDVLFAPSFAFGYHHNFAARWALEVDAMYQLEFSPRAALQAHYTAGLRASVVFQPTDGFGVFAGLGPRVIVPDVDAEKLYFAPTFHLGVQVF